MPCFTQGGGHLELGRPRDDQRAGARPCAAAASEAFLSKSLQNLSKRACFKSSFKDFSSSFPLLFLIFSYFFFLFVFLCERVPCRARLRSVDDTWLRLADSLGPFSRMALAELRMKRVEDPSKALLEVEIFN